MKLPAEEEAAVGLVHFQNIFLVDFLIISIPEMQARWEAAEIKEEIGKSGHSLGQQLQK